MNISLYDCDGLKWPNLALMKISAYHKARGDKVYLNLPLMFPQSDKIYISCVFTWNRNKIPASDPTITEIGGSGIDLRKQLPFEIERFCPDYRLYDLDYSMGFLTRGCPFNCDWCVVSRKEGTVRLNQTLDGFLRHDKVLLLDNNYLGYLNMYDYKNRASRLLDDLSGVYVDFNQGLDCRYIDQEVAGALAKLKWWAPIRLAFDIMNGKNKVERAIVNLKKVGLKNIMSYVLVGYPDGKIGDALERVEILRKEKVDPFAMLYQPPDVSNKQWAPKETREFCRWVNLKRFFKTKTWPEFLDLRLHGK